MKTSLPLTKNPLVSVIIPTYNQARLLKRTVESVLNQTYPNIEVVVVDDGSTDGTSEVIDNIIKDLRFKNKKIIYIRQENKGGTSARNTGFMASKGEYINFLDHDDLFFPEKIEKQLKVLFNYHKAGLVHCGYHRIDKDGKLIDIINYLPEGNVKKKIVLGCFLWSGAPLIRRECFEKVGLFDETVYSSDADMWVRIAMADYHFGCVQEPLGAYRILLNGEMSDVVTTEKLDMNNMDEFFAKKNLPRSILKLKNEAFFIQRFWLSSRFYTIGKWNDAQRNLLEAVKYNPKLTKDPYKLYGLFLSSAMDPRVVNSVQYIENVFIHLPEEIHKLIYGFKNSIISWVHTGIALLNYGYGNLHVAKNELEKGINLNKDIISNKNGFRCAVSDYAFRLPVDPIEYVDLILENLPSNGKILVEKRSLIISQIFLHKSFLDYYTGKWKLIPSNLIRALWNNPLIIISVIQNFVSAVKKQFFSSLTKSKIKNIV
jgi:glycosyltransferase involved in cell wall biosynthesis